MSLWVIDINEMIFMSILDGEIERQIPLFLLMEMTLHQTYGMEKLHELIKLLSIKKGPYTALFYFYKTSFPPKYFCKTFGTRIVASAF